MEPMRSKMDAQEKAHLEVMLRRDATPDELNAWRIERRIHHKSFGAAVRAIRQSLDAPPSPMAAALVAKFRGEATAEVTVAEQLNDKNLDALKAALKSVTGKDVALNVKVDPSIIGGLVVKLGSRMVDSSLRTKLNSIKHAMKEAG